MLAQKGYTIKDSADAKLELDYESDSIYRYQMLSTEFSYDEIRETDSFKIKQYRDAIYRG